MLIHTPRSVRDLCQRKALTLLELLIVLVILVALTAIAVQSIEPLADQARYESTQRTLINVDEAMVRLSLTPDRVASYSGFVADLGRLPVPVGADTETQLSELWNQGSLSTFSIVAFDDADLTDEEFIPVAAGWRGPYLSLPPGPSVLRDGFGRSFEIIVDSGSVVNVISSGANGVVDAADVDYDRDLQLPGGAWTTGRYQGSLNVTIRELDGLNDPSILSGETLRVRLYGPVNGVASLLAEVSGTEATADETVSFSQMIFDQAVGSRAIVAYVTTGATAPYTVVRQSTIKQIVVVPGMNPSVQLNLNPTP